MPTTYTDQFFVMDPANPPAVGSTLTPVTGTYVDNDDNGFIRPGEGDTFNGGVVTSVWENDTITVIMNGSTVTITGVTFYVAGQPAVFTPTDGTVLSNAQFVSSTFVTTSTEVDVDDFGPVCFTPGTLIDTPHGRRPIDVLRTGDLVLTRDNGAQPVRWISRQTTRAAGVFAPVEFDIGSLGNSEVLRVSQQHRMLLSGWRAELYFGLSETLVAAKHLVNGQNVHLRPGGLVTYIHLLFEDHEIITGGGIASESYFPAHAAEREPASMEIRALFPDFPRRAPLRPVARPVLRRFEARLWAA
ncbi:Hint domain-containing protein [Primorskyibacter sp. S187A]|uniref:Hint domain-containing protein n=1 Tax=Primorskyibacter sp. S187A TaxID=3415130 RepID=UPI003C7C1FA2